METDPGEEPDSPQPQIILPEEKGTWAIYIPTDNTHYRWLFPKILILWISTLSSEVLIPRESTQVIII